jgi:alpha-D-ribose 1-methylphosphonate 5-triphosphate synthase subunit PhnI
MYVAVKGGERAIDAAHAWLADERRGDTGIAALSVAQIREQLTLAVNRVMAEGSLYDPDLAALAIKQARGDLIEAVFLIRAYRTTLPRFGASIPVDTTKMAVARRVSATFKDLPGGQILGPTFDYPHRLLDFALMAEGEAPLAARPTPSPSPQGGGEVTHAMLRVLFRTGLGLWIRHRISPPNTFSSPLPSGQTPAPCLQSPPHPTCRNSGTQNPHSG